MATTMQTSSTPSAAVMLDLYLHLARASEQQDRPLQRDKFLVVASALAVRAGYPKISDDCRKRILSHNPNHMLKAYPSMREALKSDDVRQYATQLVRIYPYEKAEYLLQKFRAAGYNGSHGFEDLEAALGRRKATPATAQRTDSGASQTAKPHKKNGNGNGGTSSALPIAVRPELKKAFTGARPDAKPQLPIMRQQTLPLQNPQSTALPPPVNVSLTAFLCGVVFAFALGLAIGAWAANSFLAGQ
jgi:hypothetical protein